MYVLVGNSGTRVTVQIHCYHQKPISSIIVTETRLRVGNIPMKPDFHVNYLRIAQPPFTYVSEVPIELIKSISEVKKFVTCWSNPPI